MTVSRLQHIPGIGVDLVGAAADAAHDPDMLRLENLDTDLRPPQIALDITRRAIDDDATNSYLPFQVGTTCAKPPPPMSAGSPAATTTRQRAAPSSRAASTAY